MYSLILSQAYSNETSFTGLEHIAIVQRGLRGVRLAVHANPALVDEPLCITPSFGELSLDQRTHQVIGFRDNTVGHELRKVALAELSVEVCFGPRRRLLSLQSLDQLAGQRGLRVPRLQPQGRLDLRAAQARDQAQVFLDQRVGD